MLSDEEIDELSERQIKAQAQLTQIGPKYLNVTTSGTVAEAVPKIRRVIVRARELPLTVELPTQVGRTPPPTRDSHPPHAARSAPVSSHAVSTLWRLDGLIGCTLSLRRTHRSASWGQRAWMCSW
eukprot:1561722-Prymnesium_polylepis.1